MESRQNPSAAVPVWKNAKAASQDSAQLANVLIQSPLQGHKKISPAGHVFIPPGLAKGIQFPADKMETETMYLKTRLQQRIFFTFSVICE
jgi:hypothetical protein